MSIAQGTTHYGYPQVQLNDRPTFADFNPAFSDIDSKLYGLITGAATDEQAIADLGTAVGNLRTDLGGVSDVATAAKNKADANEEAIGLLSTQVSQNTTKLGTKIDSNAIAEPYDTSATYAVDDVVTYQGQRYRCTTAVAVAEPFDATKWTGEDVETVLESHAGTIAQLNTDLDAGNLDASKFVSVTASGSETRSQVFDRLHALIDFTKITKNPLVSINDVKRFCEVEGTTIKATLANCASSAAAINTITCLASSSTVYDVQISSGNVTFTNESSGLYREGVVVKFIY